MLVGKPVRFSPPEEIKTLLSVIGGDSVRLHTFQKVLRIIINGKVYFSREYKWMRKYISFAVSLQNHNEIKFGLVKYFVHDQDSGETFAVMDIPGIGDTPPALSRFALHYIWCSKEGLEVLPWIRKRIVIMIVIIMAVITIMWPRIDCLMYSSSRSVGILWWKLLCINLWQTACSLSTII